MLIFFSAILGTIMFILTLADGHSDPYYLKLSSPEKTNLIIGTSKAAQGIQPHVLQDLLHKDFYNYAFSIHSSPYGEVYLNSIKQKLNKKEKDNIFILTIDAWSICSKNIGNDKNHELEENKSFLKTTTNVCQNPNFSYLIHSFEGGYYQLLFNNKSVAFLHNNGWLEVSLDTNGVKRRTEFTLKDYKEKVNQYSFSKVRFFYLLETIDYLNQYGKVYLIRLPIHNDLLKIEESLMPNFNETIQIAKDKTKGYLDLTLLKDNFNYTDGVHLNKSSGKRVSRVIANWIKNTNEHNSD